MRSRLSPWLLAVCLTAVAALPSAAAPGWLGVSTQSTDADLRRGLDLTRDGLLVNRVFDGTPAERAGLQKGDVILRFNGTSVTEPEQLRDAVRGAGSGKSAKIEVWRDGASKTLDVKLAEVPSSEQESYSWEETPVPPTPPTPPSRSRAPELERNAPPAPSAPRAPKSPSAPKVKHKVYVNGRELSDEEIEDKLRDLRIEGWGDVDEFKHLKLWADGQAPMVMGSSRGRLGVRVEKLSPQMGEALGVTGDKGVVVLEVIEDTPAQKAGLRAGDVILEVGGRDVSDRDDLTQALREQSGKVDIVPTRKGARRTIQVDLPERSGLQGYRWESGPGEKTFTFRIPEPGRAPGVYRYPTERESGDAELRAELDQLKQEMSELKQQLGGKQDKAQPKPKAQPAPKAQAAPKK